MANAVHHAVKWIDGINDWTGRILSMVIVLIVVFTVYDVGSRAIFARPTDWAFEVTKQLYAFHFMMLGAYALLRRAHVEVDIFKEGLASRGRAILEILGYLIFFLPFITVVILWGYDFAARAWRYGETTYGIISIPIYPIKTVIVISAVLLLLQALAIVARAVSPAINKSTSLNNVA